MSFRVVLDGRWIQMGSGIGEYCYRLARSLPDAAPDVDLRVALPHSDDPLVRDLAEEAKVFRPVRMRSAPLSPGGVAELLRELVREGPAVYHSPDWMALPALLPRRWPTVATIHDLIPLVAPQDVPRSFKSRHPRLYRWTLRSLASRADAIITDTRAWAGEIARRLGIRGDRIHSIALGVQEPRPVAPAEIEATRARFGLGDAPYVLTVGRPEPYKGLAALIRAFAHAALDERLVVAGPLDPRYPEAAATIAALGLEGRVTVTGAVDPPVLEALYAGARAFATLSRHEGFGLPPLEAAARGVPVLATHCSVFPEVLGDAALLVEPRDERATAEALRRVCRDASLRARLAEAGPRQAAAYSWGTCAARTAALYRSLAPARDGARA